MKENFSEKTLLQWEYFVHFILCQKERKRHWVVRRAQPCVLRFRVVDHFIPGGRHLWVSKYHSNCVRGEIYFKEIVSNTRLDLNHSFFMHLVCEFLIICRFILIYIQYLFIARLPYLFVFLFIFRFVCCFFCLITKVNCWNISNGKLSLSLFLSHRSSLSFSLIDPLSICRNRFSLRTIFSKEESSFVNFTDARKKGFPTTPIKTHFKYASIFPQSLFIPIENHVKFCPLKMGMMLNCVCVSNFGIGGGFGFNRGDKFVNFIWVSCFFFFLFSFLCLILIGISSTGS